MAGVIKELFADIKLVSHIHTVASIKQALKLSIPVVVNFRSPIDTIISSVLKELSLDKDWNFKNLVINEEKKWEILL